MSAKATWDQSSFDEEIRRFKRGVVRGALRHFSAAGCGLEDEIQSDTFVHPGWASLHSPQLRAEMSVKAFASLIKLLDRPNNLLFDNGGELGCVFAHSLARQSGRASVKRDKPVVYHFAGSEKVRELKPVVDESLELLRQVWPQQYNFIRQTVTHLIFFQAAQEWSSCDTLTFGAIYYNPEFGCSVIDLAEGLIHEAAHHSLYIKQTFEKLVTNPDVLCKSPLRPDPRPVMALFHAVFVLKRILEFYRRINIPHPRANQYRLDLTQGLETLKNTACFTPFGQKLFESLSTSAHLNDV